MPEETTPDAKPAVPNTPRPMPVGGMVSPLVPGLSMLDIAGMIGAVCDPNDPDACEAPPASDVPASPSR